MLNLLVYDTNINKLEIDYLLYDKIKIFDYILAKRQHFIKYIFTVEIGDL